MKEESLPTSQSESPLMRVLRRYFEKKQAEEQAKQNGKKPEEEK